VLVLKKFGTNLSLDIAVLINNMKSDSKKQFIFTNDSRKLIEDKSI